MKTFEIRIQTEARADREFIQTFKAAHAGKKIKSSVGVYFTSLEAVRNLLTEKRLELLSVIKDKHPKSIYELAKMTGRNFRNVYDDVQILKYYGLVQMKKPADKLKKTNRPRAQIFSVPYQAINIHAGI